MRPSQRIQAINRGGLDGWEILHLAPVKADAGADVIDLTIGDHDAHAIAVMPGESFGARLRDISASPSPGPWMRCATPFPPSSALQET